MNFINSFILWLGFFCIVIIGLIIDFFLKKKYLYKYDIFKQSFIISVLWFFNAIFFAFFLWIYLYLNFNINIANKKIALFLYGYIIEKSLSLDNVLTWFILFKYFFIPFYLQREVLIYGIFGSFLLRSIFIFSGYWFLLHWNWIFFLFGIFLFFTAIELVFSDDKNSKVIENNFILKYFRIIFRITKSLHQKKFFIYLKGKWYVTPLFISLLMIEGSDIIFSIDSIPAIFAITNDPFIIITSNIFAVFGLRSIYFLISSIVDRLNYIKLILSFILIIISIKMIFENFIFILNNMVAFFISLFLVILFIYNFFKKYKLK